MNTAERSLRNLKNELCRLFSVNLPAISSSLYAKELIPSSLQSVNQANTAPFEQASSIFEALILSIQNPQKMENFLDILKSDGYYSDIRNKILSDLGKLRPISYRN